MARGRFITSEIARDKRINELSDDTSRLAFTWLITFADCEGRTYGDPALLRSMLFPRRQDINIEKMREYVKEWSLSGLIVWYQANDDLYIWFPAFEKNQSGLRKDREAPSIIPEYTGDTPLVSVDELRTNSGLTPDEIPVKLIKDKLIKDVAKNHATTPNSSDEPNRHTGSPEDLAYYRLQEHFLDFSGLPKPNLPNTKKGWAEFNTLWKTPGKTILKWVEYDENKAQVLVEEAVTTLSKDKMTICNFNSIIKTAASELSKRTNGNGTH